MKPNTCAICGTPTPERSGPGRPSAYCSPTCRRFAEHSIRRLDRNIDRVSAKLGDARVELAKAKQSGYQVGAAKAEVTAWESELRLAEERLRELLASGPDSGTVEEATIGGDAVLA